jgi:hypothetical protein
LWLAEFAPPIDEFKNFPEGGPGKIESGHDERFPRAQDGPGRRGFGHGGKRRGVAAADVLGKGGLDGLADFCGGQFHTVRMKANGKGEKEKRAVEKAIKKRSGQKLKQRS